MFEVYLCAFEEVSVEAGVYLKYVHLCLRCLNSVCL